MEISSKYPAKSLSKEIAKLRTDTKKREKALRGEEILYNGEFDRGSGLTLSAGLRHASLAVTCCSNTMMTSGARVRNTCVTYLIQEHNVEKSALTFHNIICRHL